MRGARTPYQKSGENRGKNNKQGDCRFLMRINAIYRMMHVSQNSL